MSSLVELEGIASRGWQGTTSQSLGDWLLRAGGGFTGRANSVLALGSPGVALSAAVVTVHDFYRRHQLPAMFQVPFDVDDPEGAQSHLSARLQGLGWQPFNATSVRVASLAAASAAFPTGSIGTPVHEATPSHRWLAGYHYRGRPLPPNAVAVLTNAADPTFLSLVEGDELLGVARGIVTDGWLGVTAVTVVEHHRRRGVGSALMGELVRWAGARGATEAYLQVDVANEAALGMYGRGGFVEHHRYHYLQLPPS